AHQ
ncbi:hypothetical protein ECEC1862_2859, partial [Escherichia coli EC1862]